ncbi:MAG: amidohydrolase family protein [Acidimicrobiaceae bacterium]|nr:amidohydrolase family protein [Acidimicrobiaceae bacterium]
MSTNDSTTVIRGGTVIDGSGTPGISADVLIAGGKIVEIGHNLVGDQVLDATGCVVAPGFIDIHTHYDAQIFWDPALTPSCFHGVTTVVGGNCGFSIAPVRPGDRELMANTMEKVEDMDPATLLEGVPWDFESFPEYLDSVEQHGSLLNFSAYVGHTAVRLYAMGDDAVGRAATADEIESMAVIVREAMEAGAVGFATSFAITHIGADGSPIPSRWADRAEIEALFTAVADTGRGIIGVNGGDNLSLRENYPLQKQIGIPFTYTAVLTNPKGGHLKALEINRQGWEDGAEVWPQVTCRPLSFSMTMVEPFTLNTNPVFAELAAGTIEERRAAYADSGWRDRAREAWKAPRMLVPRWDTMEVMMSAANADLVGARITDLAESTGSDPFDTLMELTLAEDDLMLRIKVVLANDDVEGIAILLQDERTTLGLSDAGAHVGQLCDAPQATDLLGNWVRDRNVMPMETAIRKLSGQQADLFGFVDRGYLRPGYWADITVFDPETIDPGPVRRVRDFPANAERLTADAPTGIRHVLVNGQPIQVDGEIVTDAVNARPGQLLRSTPRVATSAN